ncbi:hypothetical protein SH449x_000303 [Pirellulaceae bacterium SH449]
MRKSRWLAQRIVRLLAKETHARPPSNPADLIGGSLGFRLAGQVRLNKAYAAGHRVASPEVASGGNASTHSAC